MNHTTHYKDPQSLLSKVSITSLSRFVGSDRSQWLSDMGINVDQNSLAALCIVQSGIGFLDSQNIRNEILFSHGFDKSVIEEFKDFKLGKNRDTEKLLRLLEVSPAQLPPKRIKKAALEKVSAERCLFPYQNWMRKNINEFLKDPLKRRAIVHMPTGAGKTRTAMEAIIDFTRSLSESKVSIIWVAHSEELCQQAYEQIVSLWEKHATEEACMVRLWGGNSSVELEDDKPNFVITSFQTIHSMVSSQKNNYFKKVASLQRRNALLVVDEAHQSTAATYQSVIEFLTNSKSKVLGLTATPGRDDLKGKGNATQELAAFYEYNKLDIVDDDGHPLDDPIKYLQEKNILAPVERIRLETNTYVQLTSKERIKVERSLEIPDSVLKRLSEDNQRTNLIVAQTMILAVEKKLQTIVFAASKQNAIDLAVLLELRGCAAAAITDESSDRAISIKRFKDEDIKVLTNYGVLSTGFDAPNIGAVVIGRPTLSVVLYSQMLGRGLRGKKMGGLPNCVLLDVIDNIDNMPSSEQAFTYFDNYY